MQKFPFIFIILLPLVNIINANALEIELNKNIFMPGDKLVIFGNAIPNDSLIIELFNPTGNMIYRTQLDISANGNFALILLRWPEPDDNKFRIGTYTLLITSSISNEKNSKVLLYQLQTPKEKSKDITNKLSLSLSMPSIAKIGEEVPIIANVRLNDLPLIGLESINAIIDSSNGSITLDNFIAIDDGIYKASFNSNITGYHTIIVNTKHQDLFVKEISIIKIEKNDNELDYINNEINSIKALISNKTNTIDNDISNINDSLVNVTSAIGQLTSLLLPILGMIAIIVALQATILAKHK